jgi:hypothetical protein
MPRWQSTPNAGRSCPVNRHRSSTRSLRRTTSTIRPQRETTCSMAADRRVATECAGLTNDRFATPLCRGRHATRDESRVASGHVRLMSARLPRCHVAGQFPCLSHACRFRNVKKLAQMSIDAALTTLYGSTQPAHPCSWRRTRAAREWRDRHSRSLCPGHEPRCCRTGNPNTQRLVPPLCISFPR